MDLIQKLEPELVFLDVNMPGLDGLGVVRRLRERDVELPHFIFVTAYDQYAVEAFRLEAMDYLLKPVERGRLAETIERARRAIQDKRAPVGSSGRPGRRPAPAPAPRTKLLVRANNRNFIVDANDVIYATIDDHRRRQRQHRCLVGLERVDRADLGRAHHPGVRRAQPIGELGVEVRR